MDDLSEKLAELLNDGETLNKVRAMAENLLGSEDKKDEAPKADSIFDGSGFDPSQIAGIMSVISRLKDSTGDSRSNLLLALKPLLSAPRQIKVDTAIKLLRLIDMLPLIKDSGLFEF